MNPQTTADFALPETLDKTAARIIRRARTAGGPRSRRGEGHGGPREQQDDTGQGYGRRRGRGGYGGRS